MLSALLNFRPLYDKRAREKRRNSLCYHDERRIILIVLSRPLQVLRRLAMPKIV